LLTFSNAYASIVLMTNPNTQLHSQDLLEAGESPFRKYVKGAVKAAGAVALAAVAVTAIESRQPHFEPHTPQEGEEINSFTYIPGEESLINELEDYDLIPENANPQAVAFEVQGDIDSFLEEDPDEVPTIVYTIDQDLNSYYVGVGSEEDFAVTVSE
jgi:hypothetical protein